MTLSLDVKGIGSVRAIGDGRSLLEVPPACISITTTVWSASPGKIDTVALPLRSVIVKESALKDGLR